MASHLDPCPEAGPSPSTVLNQVQRCLIDSDDLLVGIAELVGFELRLHRAAEAAPNDDPEEPPEWFQPTFNALQELNCNMQTVLEQVHWLIALFEAPQTQSLKPLSEEDGGHPSTASHTESPEDLVLRGQMETELQAEGVTKMDSGPPQLLPATVAEIFQVQKHILAIDPFCRVPDLLQATMPTETAYRLACVIRSSLAAQQFVDLVHQWRKRRSDLSLPGLEEMVPSLAQYAIYLKRAVKKTFFGSIQTRICQASMAREVDRHGESRKHLKTGIRRDAQKKSGMSEGELNRHISQGMLWNRLCGPYVGMVPFVSHMYGSTDSFNIRKEAWFKLRGEELEQFHDLLRGDHMANICSAGATFERIVVFGSTDVFEWEEDDNFNIMTNMDRIAKCRSG